MAVTYWPLGEVFVTPEFSATCCPTVEAELNNGTSIVRP